MLDSSDKNGDFCPKSELLKLCESKKLGITTSKVSFGRGWLMLVKDFIESVGKCSILITQVDDSKNVLDIEVDFFKTSQQTNVYKQILRAKARSEVICANCGEVKETNNNKFCKQCKDKSAELNITGTWLDKY